MQNDGEVVEARGLTRIYRRGRETVHAIQDIDLTVETGEFVGLVSRSGSGKTTLLNLIGLMDRPTSGELHVLGHDIGRRGADLDQLRLRNIGFVFQDFYLLPGLSIVENVLLPRLWGRRDMTETSDVSDRVPRTDTVAELLDRVQLSHRMHHRPSELSGGEMQRVAIARALVNRPRLLLADEPTGNLDTRTRDSVFDLFAELNRQGLTILVATHDRSLTPRFNRTLELEEGHLR